MIALPLWLQYLLVALAVLASAAVVMRKQFPNATRRLRLMLALPLARPGRPKWMHALARRIAPPVQGGGKECGGCSGCD
ncbi:hypothetical protein LJB71_10365 [Thermomonas sp. S9]|uniref:DUF6587 family protein n=1 Tax=Thermomonas sp. TaxID=1971895 RepID=UPI0031C2275E|nr:hypothetical protein [Thermomonas sp. S9]